MHTLLAAAAIAILPLVMAGSGIHEPIPWAHAANKDVCGVQLCSEIEGGWDAWMASMDDLDTDTDTMPVSTVGIPLHKGYYDGWAAYYIITDSSEPVHSGVITESQGWPVQDSQALSMVPEDARSITYMFTNGIKGSGVHGFQAEVFTSAPGKSAASDYSPLTGHVHVVWKSDAIPKILDSEAAILEAKKIGDLDLVEVDVVINMPQFVISPAQSEMLDRMTERTMMLPLHPGFYDGNPVYGLALDSSSREQAAALGVTTKLESNYSPGLGAAGDAHSKVYVFANGIEGTGISGFQPQVFASGLGADSYTPLAANIYVSWAEGSEPRVLESESDIMLAAEAGELTIENAGIVTNMPLLVLDDDDAKMMSGGMAGESEGGMTMMMPDDAMTAGDMTTHDDTAMPDDVATGTTEPNDLGADAPAMHLGLARASVPATIPLHMGYYDGESVYYIITDSSDMAHADIITESQEWQVEYSPSLAMAPADARSITYMFTNGIKGSGVHGFQPEIFTSTPEQGDHYSPLAGQVHVTWDADAKPRMLDSEGAILEAEAVGDLEIAEIDVVINMPQIIWPGGQMPVKDDATIHDDTAYGGGQITDIDTDKMTVTFVAHRGWGPDGRTIYYIVTDATPSGPAAMMGVVTSDSTAALLLNSAAVDLYQFANGIEGPGPLGFQPGIASAALGDMGYSPMWRIYIITWNDPADARLLQTLDDINYYLNEDMITISLARPMDSDHIVNCPFIDPFQ